MPADARDLAHARQVAADIVAEAGEIALSLFHRGVRTEEKGDRDLVSEADRLVEGLIAERLGRAFPDDAIVGEEGVGTQATAPVGLRRWYVDPIDGTTNFLKGLPLWGVSLGLAGPDDELMAGAIALPRAGELYSAAIGQGATCNGADIRASRVDRLDRVLVCYAHPGESADQWGGPDQLVAGYRRLTGSALGTRLQGCATADLTSVAAGRIDACWSGGMSPWDVAAGLVIATEAGARITDPDGAEVRTVVPALLATPPAVHEAIRELIGAG